MMISTLCTLALLAAQPKPIAEIPFRIGDDSMIIDSVVNGVTVSCMFDTGYSGSYVLNESVNIGKPDGSANLQDFVGVFEAKTVSLKSLKVGTLNVEPKTKLAVKMPNNDYSLNYGQHVVGIMGLEVFSDYIFEISFEDKKIYIYPKTYDITKVPGDGEKTFNLKMLPIGNNSIELSVRTADDEKMHLALDTGNAFYATTHRDVLVRLGMWTDDKAPMFVKQSMVASGAVDSWDLMMKDLTIFGVPVESSIWNIIDLPASSADHDGTVGFGFLKNFNITIDMERRRVLLENFTGKAGNDPLGEPGISAFWHPGTKRMTIYRVSKGSPADEAGIKVGDQILDVDGTLIGQIGFRKMYNLLTGEVGSTVKLALSRDGTLMRYEIKRAVLVNQAVK